MKNLILLLGVFVVFSCKAQQTYPLKTDYTEIPNNSHLKDLNNELNSFTGNWIANYNGNEITLFITKENDKYFKRGTHIFYKDILSIRYTVKNSNEIILQSTKNQVFQSNQILHTMYSYWPDNGGTNVTLYYGGTNCGIGWGEIILKKLNATQISWDYLPNGSLIDSATCPQSTDKKVYLPVTKGLIFTKQ